ncbi:MULTISPECIES: BREX-1 system adenine-specific DNA-methyltransferase PglX [Marinobacter]|uniref:BREX-1 system adenine-specific DNA-methyltransferase PglX n=1 Tax=Marinobacter TaxID=2742 RepID=UPI003B4385E7|nr:BREX-1 system adenine-specific DNA-methyltransferase PglX [Marinobacter alkaliphilus]
MSQQETKDMSKHFYRASAADFKKVPGKPIAYWLTENALSVFERRKGLVGDLAKAEGKNVTTNNDRFIRFFWEVSKQEIGAFDKHWLPCAMGGGYRKWYGNVMHVIDWSDHARLHYKSAPAGRIIRKEFWGLPGITWGKIGSRHASFRILASDEMYQETAVLQESEDDAVFLLSLLNSKVSNYFLQFFSPTVNFQLEDISAIPMLDMTGMNEQLLERTQRSIQIAKKDWDSAEFSLQFSGLELVNTRDHSQLLQSAFDSMRLRQRDLVSEMRSLEEENNQMFISTYGLEGELSAELRTDEITLICNPFNRYGGDRLETELESMFRCDTLRELVSYAIGCMMGRYSLDQSGLILASKGETIQDYLGQIPSPCFAPDDDAILPLTDLEWFADDATNRFREFVRVVWGDEHLQENLDFVAESLCLHAIKSKRDESALDTIRRYLSTQFYKDHLRTYKKRPIYWLFSSGKHKAFECLVYLHRYNEGTLARMRTEYVIPLSAKLNAYTEKLEQDKETSTSAAETKRLEKEIATLHKQQSELAEFDEKLRHYADQRISLDLDDGVKVNYGKFGDLLAEVKAVTGGKP